MKPDDAKLDLAAPAALLELGRALCHLAGSCRTQQSEMTSAAAAVQLEATMAELAKSPTAKKLLGLNRNRRGDGDGLRVSIAAVVAWKMLSVHVPAHFVSMSDLAADVTGENAPCEDMLTCRHVAGVLASEGILVLNGREGWNAEVALSPKVLNWVVGGRYSLAVLSARRLAAARCGVSNQVEATEPPQTILTPRQIAERIGRRVFGLDEQIRTLAVRLSLHQTRAALLRAKEDPGTPNEVLLVLGDPGVGKTFLAEAAAAACGLPCGVCNAAELTAAGYVGIGAEDGLRDLIAAAGGDVERSRWGVMVYDEATKKCRRDDMSSAYGAAVQGELLRIVSGCQVQIGGKRSSDPPIFATTVGTLFCLVGHCPGLPQIMQRRLGRRAIGFGRPSGGGRDRSILTAALEDYGFLPELTSRLTGVLALPAPSLDSLMRAAAAPEGIVASFNRLLGGRGVVLHLEPAAAKELASHGLETRNYFRAMKAVVARIIEETLYDGREGALVVTPADVRRAVERMGAAEAVILSRGDGVEAETGASA